ncbi:MAG: nickel pincer cofactor biosynthesis protein LarB, partial [candidate division NC10 bacterium]|nr:nickel pincer cofactor biosynthesis protein LarB [candidate division NC10 bacterium]
LGYAKVDLHRGIRQGFPEVVFCQGKTLEQTRGIAERILASHNSILATRASEEIFQCIYGLDPRAVYNPLARTVVVKEARPPLAGKVLVITAGTSDIPVAEEAVVTAEFLGTHVDKLYDVGVAGIHRLLDGKEMLFGARVIVVVAGMEGALPSVVGGLVDKPIIAVPTSVGYGASFGGLAALLAMLNSCSSGLAVVNIDNGFGAGLLAHKINMLGEK